MNLYHLRYFVTLAHLEHYTKAAEILAITQPSLSHAISSLEKELGVKLFEKDGRNVVLTKCGQAFLTDVEQSLEMLDSSVNRLQMTGLGEGRVDIGMLRTLSSTVPKFVKDFLDSKPNKNSFPSSARNWCSSFQRDIPWRNEILLISGILLPILRLHFQSKAG